MWKTLKNKVSKQTFVSKHISCSSILQPEKRTKQSSTPSSYFSSSPKPLRFLSCRQLNYLHPSVGLILDKNPSHNCPQNGRECGRTCPERISSRLKILKVIFFVFGHFCLRCRSFGRDVVEFVVQLFRIYPLYQNFT